MADDAAREAAAARKNLNAYEDTLVEMATLSAQKWAILEDMLEIWPESRVWVEPLQQESGRDRNPGPQ